MKLHILSSPEAPTNLESPSNAFTVIIWKYVKYLNEHFNIIHYGIEGADVPCQHVNLPAGDKNKFNKEAAKAIMKTRDNDDVIICCYGTDNQLAAEMHDDLKIVEPLIGYKTNAVFAPYRVFPSYAQMHYFYGERNMLLEASWFDEMIPNPINPDDFIYNESKDNYLLYMGRVVEEKGVRLAIEIAKATKHKLVIAGLPRSLKNLGFTKTPNHVQLIGGVNAEQRAKVLSKAKALIAPTFYIEPFGNMVPEAHLSGTPTITTDWGGMSETNIHGKTGFRCRLFRDFTEAVNNIEDIDKKFCYDNAYANYRDEVILEQHKNYLNRVITNDYYK